MTQQPRTGSAMLYNGPLLALIAKLLSEKPLRLTLIFQRGFTVRQAGALTIGYTTTPLSCATPHTELWHTQYWATQHPILSCATPHTELWHTPYWATLHPILSCATPYTELCHTPYWAMPHPIQSYTTPHTELCHTLCMYVCFLAGRYDNPIPTRFLALIDAQGPNSDRKYSYGRWQGPHFLSELGLRSVKRLVHYRLDKRYQILLVSRAPHRKVEG